jgi:cytochrome oxidase assembly protein ShyY1
LTRLTQNGLGQFINTRRLRGKKHIVAPVTHNALRLAFTPNRAIMAFALVFLPVLLLLGFWQLDRAEQKRQLQQTIQARQADSPTDLSHAALDTLQDYTRVIAQGEFDNQYIWLVDNRLRDGRVGFEVVQVFKLDHGPQVLVNRGWLPAPTSRTQMPNVPLHTGSTRLFAELYPVSQHPLLNAQGETPHWPRIITEVNTTVMGESIGQTLSAGILKLDDASPAALQTGWQPINMTAARHTGYAVQWFALALVLALLTLLANTNIMAWWRSGRQHKTS